MQVKQIIIHHTDSSRDKTTLADVNAWHKARDFNLSSLGYYVGYHYLILGNGQIIQTRRDNEIGCHCVPNEGRVGICLAGRFETEMPSEAQLNALEPLLNKLKLVYRLSDSDIFGHCEKSATFCPGKNLMVWLKLYRKLSLLKLMVDKLKKLLGIK